MLENDYWLRLWKYVIIGATIVLLGMSGCTINRHNKTAEVIMSGADPIRTGMAMRSGASRTKTIAALLSDNTKEKK